MCRSRHTTICRTRRSRMPRHTGNNQHTWHECRNEQTTKQKKTNEMSAMPVSSCGEKTKCTFRDATEKWNTVQIYGGRLFSVSASSVDGEADTADKTHTQEDKSMTIIKPKESVIVVSSSLAREKDTTIAQLCPPHSDPQPPPPTRHRCDHYHSVAAGGVNRDRGRRVRRGSVRAA